MAKYEAKTKAGTASVKDFIDAVEDGQMREDCHALVGLFSKATGHEAVLWTNIIGYGHYHYKYDSGHEGEFFVSGFAPRKGGIALYTNMNLEEGAALLKKLGKYKSSKSCITIKKLADVDMEVLAEIIRKGRANLKKKYPSAT